MFTFSCRYFNFTVAQFLCICIFVTGDTSGIPVGNISIETIEANQQVFFHPESAKVQNDIFDVDETQRTKSKITEAMLKGKGKPSSTAGSAGTLPSQPIPTNVIQIGLPSKPNIQHIPSPPVIISKPTLPDITFVKPTGLELEFVKPQAPTIQKPSFPDITFVPSQKPTLTLPSLPDLTIVKPSKPSMALEGVSKPLTPTQSPIINKIIGLMIKLKSKVHALTGINIQFDKPVDPGIMPLLDKMNQISGKLSNYYNRLEDFLELFIMDTPFRSMKSDVTI